MITELAAESAAYQTYLEAVRTHPDDDLLREDLERARRAMVRAWLEQLGSL
jgi:hypothetical protein